MRLVGHDLPIHAPREQYRDLVRRIKSDEHARGALITTHKIDLFEACRDMFDAVDQYARLCGETSCLAKRGGQLLAFAKGCRSPKLECKGLTQSKPSSLMRGLEE